MLAKYLYVKNYFAEDSTVYAAGYMFWRYLIKKASDNYGNTKDYAFKDASSIGGTGKIFSSKSGVALIFNVDSGNKFVKK